MTPILRLLSRRSYSTQQLSTSSTKSTSPHVGFYQSFGRPIAKVFLSAVVTYQVVYWLWLKLETDEIKYLKNGEIKSLEAELKKAKSAR